MRNAPVTTTLGKQGVYQDAQVLQTLMHRFVPLQAPLTSTDFDGDSFPTTAKTVIDLSVEFGAPAGIRAALFRYAIRDAGSAANDTWVILSPTNVATTGITADCHPVDDRWTRGAFVVPCDANGDVYYQIQASGAGLFELSLQIWGYFI